MSDEFKCRNCGECCIAFEIGPLENEDVTTFAYKSYFDKDGDELIEESRAETARSSGPPRSSATSPSADGPRRHCNGSPTT